MTWFRLETIRNDGKLVKSEHVNISGIHTVEQAARTPEISSRRLQAARNGLGFRIKREDS